MTPRREHGRGAPSPAPEDHRVWRPDHAAFVGAVGLIAAAVCVAVPIGLRLSLIRCKGSECLSLERDMKRAMDPGADPCSNFYQHVCGRWVSGKTDFAYVTYKYRNFRDKDLMHELVTGVSLTPNRHQTTRDKLALLYLSCHAEVNNEESIGDFLRVLGLTWPKRSHSSAFEALAASSPPSVEYATPGRAPASSGDGGDNGGRRRRRTNSDRQRLRAEMLALARSPGCWRPLLVFVFSLVIGLTLALAAYGIRGSRLDGRAMPRRGNGTY
nr:uncharacterized protein LOC126540915 isoform X3 [Dermacentor andersoni]